MQLETLQLVEVELLQQQIQVVVEEEYKMVMKLHAAGIPPISEYDPELIYCWFVPREVIPKKTKKGKPYWIVEVIDSNNQLTKIRCWGIKPEKDRIFVNRPYGAELQYNEKWGFSTRCVGKTFKLLA